MVFRVRIAVSILCLVTCTVLVGTQLVCRASRGLDEREADRPIRAAEMRHDQNQPDCLKSTYARTISQLL